ncbi:MAG: hypothetical protein WC799_24125 [Desulfobacteraceae bacterium]
MDIETFAKGIGAFGVIYTIGRGIVEHMAGRTSKMRDEYRFAKDFFKDLKDHDNIHPYVLEKGYQAIAGTPTIKSQEVRYILTLEDSATCLKDFVLARDYLKHLNTNGNLQITFLDKYSNPQSRFWRKWLYIGLYGVLALGALSPIILLRQFGLSAKQAFTLLVLSLPLLGYYAVVSLRSAVKINRAEKLVLNQRQHTQRIITGLNS